MNVKNNSKCYSTLHPFGRLMGIEGLWSKLNDHDKRVTDPADRVLEPIEDFCAMFRDKTVAMDVSIFMHQIIDSNADPSVFYTNLYDELKSFDINIEFYFDGKRAPIKQHEHRRRQEARLAEERRQAERRRMMEKLQSSSDKTVESVLTEARDTDPGLARELAKQTQLHIPGLIEKDAAPKLQVDVSAVITSLAQRINKHDDRETVSSIHYQDLMRTFRMRNIPFLVAASESEKLGAQKVREGTIAAFITNDGDALTFGCPLMVRNFRKFSQPLQMVRLDRVLRALNVNYAQFVDVCVISGCDFTESRGLPMMGMVKALEVIRTHGSLDNYIESAAFRGYLRRLQTSKKYNTFTMDQFQHRAARDMFVDRTDQVVHIDDDALFDRDVATNPASNEPPSMIDRKRLCNEEEEEPAEKEVGAEHRAYKRVKSSPDVVFG